MKIAFVGVNHYDPLGRTRLRSCLQQMAGASSHKPDFIAVEYPEHIFSTLAAQRPLFRQILAGYFNVENFPGLEQEAFEEIGNSYAYEGDTHEAVFPSIDVLWLPTETGTDLAERPATSVRVLSNAIPKQSLRDLSSAEVLLGISECFWQRHRNEDRASGCDFARDHLFATAIGAKAERHSDGWAIAIIGAAHCDDHPESTVNLMRDTGYSTAVQILDH